MNVASPDRQLVRAMLDGDERAFEEFYASFTPRLYRFLLKRVAGDVTLAEEICHEVLTKAMGALSRYRAEATLFTWLCQIARNALTDHWRKQNRRDVVEVFVEDDPTIAAALESLEMEGVGPEGQQLQSELAQFVEVALDRLPPAYGNVLEWKYVDGLSVAEIATRMDTGVIAVQSMLARARSAFRDAFTTLVGDDHPEYGVALEGRR